MYRKKLIFTAFLSFSLLASGYSTYAREKKSYTISAFSNYSSLPANTAAVAKTQKLAATHFPAWVVTTDKISGLFTDIYGQPLSVAGTGNVEKVQGLMAGKLASMGINKADWKLVRSITAPKADYVNYVQVIDGHPVVFARLSFRFTKGGDLARIQMKNYGSPAGTMTPVITMAAARSIAIKDIEGATITKNDIDANWSWFPVPKAGGYELRPAWKFSVKGKIPGHLPLILTGYIDAITGTILYRDNEVRDAGFDLTVKGNVYKNGTTNPATLEPLVDLELDPLGSGPGFTNSLGIFTNPSLILPLSTDIPLQGNYSTVFDDPTGNTPFYSTLVSLPGTTYTYPESTPYSERHVNAYYHTTRIHNYMKSFFPAFTDLDFSMPTNVDVTGSGSCNAFYGGGNINFLEAGGGCFSFANLGDVVYHEYGHAINDFFYTSTFGSSMMNGALNEAIADVWALSVTHDPVMAKNSFVGFGGFIRRYDVTPQVYPIDLEGIDPHKDGQIISGTWWDVGVNLGSADSMTKLFTDVYFDGPDGPPGTEGAVYQSILIDALMADDNNANLLDGTPHYAKIVAAFAKHGIYLEGDATMTNGELNNKPAGIAIPVALDLVTSNPGTPINFLHDLTLYYRLNGAGTWNALLLTASGSSYTGNIPAQPQGTVVEYYYAMHDALGIVNGYFPVAFNPTIPANQSNIPYQFAVGVKKVDSNDFEGSVTGWHIGFNSGDNAASGQWKRRVPNTFSVFTGAFIGPDADHTTGFGQCLETLDNGDQIVSSGTTTAISPVFDISGYSSPVIEYSRWYSNDAGFDNFKNDPWVVKIRNAANTSWVTVESTYQGDNKWRRRVFPVSAYLPSGTAQIQVKFFASDSTLATWSNNGQSNTIGAVDDFIIYDRKTVTVPEMPVAKAEVYPNPADENINIKLQQGSAGAVSLYDLTGKKIMSMPLQAGISSYVLNTHDIVPGIYSLMIETDKSVEWKKIAVTHK